jgi:hypothetical protein
MRKLFVFAALLGLLGITGVSFADPNLTLTTSAHRHFVVLPTGAKVEVGPRWCNDLTNLALKAAFTQFHANAHTQAGVTGEIGSSPAPGLHNLAGPEIDSQAGCAPLQ